MLSARGRACLLLVFLCGCLSLPGASQVLATLTSPAPGSLLTSSSVTFKWTTGSGVSAYWLRLGTTGTGSSNLFSSGSLAGTSVAVTGIPLQGATVYATLFSSVNGAWKPVNYTYTEVELAALASPAPGAAFPGSSVTFNWTAGTGVSAYWLHLGTTGAGSSNLYSSGSQSGTSVTVNNLPLKGVTVYATLYSNVQGVWMPVNYTYTEAPTLAALTSPAAGSTLTGSTVTFNWTAGAGVTAYWLRVGSTGAGSSDLFSSGSLSGTSVTVNGIPMKGAHVYATLYSSVQGVWTPVSYTYTEAATLPAFTSPAAGSIFPGSTETFKWTAGAGITAYWLHLGTKGTGSSDLYSSGSTSATSVTVSGLPLNGVTVYATLYASINGGAFQSVQAQTYTLPALAALTSPASGSVLSGSSATFNWSAGTGVASYWLHLGTKGAGSDDLYSSGAVTGTSVSVSGLPTYGMTVYATLYSNLSGTWTPVGYTLIEAGSPVLGALTSPASGSRLSGSTVTFKWSAGHGPTAYWLKLGTSAGADNIYSSGSLTGTSITVSGLPTSGIQLYATLDSQVNGAWEPESSTMVEAAPAVASVSCANGTYYAAGTDACTVTLNSAALAGAVTVALSSNNAAVKVPASVTIAKGALSAGFNATVSAVTSAQSVTLTAVAGGASQAFAIQVDPPTPALTVNGVSFGNVDVNTPVSQQVVLTSSGTAPLTINSVTASGTGFSVSGGSFPVTLNPTQTATVQVQFDPTSAGAASGSLSISSNAAAGATTTVNLSGTGIPTPSTVSCNKSSMTGSGTDACTVTLNAAAATSGAAVTLSSNNSAVTVPASVTVGSGSTSVGFSATVSWVLSAQTVTLKATTGGVSKTFALQLNAATPTLGLGATTVAFGSVPLRDPSTQSLTLTSTGTAPVTISAASVSSGTGYSLSPTTFPITINPQQTASLELVFDPTNTGYATAQLTITSNSSSGSTATVTLTGTGMATSYQVNLSWDAPTGTDQIEGYNVYRAIDGSSSYQIVNPSLDTQTNYSDTTVSSGVTYDYYVESVDASQVSSAPSTVLTISVP